MKTNIKHDDRDRATLIKNGETQSGTRKPKEPKQINYS